MLLIMNPDAVIEAFSKNPDRALISPLLLRLARGQEGLRPVLSGLLDDPKDLSLCGIESAADAPPSDALADTVRWAWTRIEEGRPPPVDMLARLEERATGDLEWWGPAARLHARCSVARENQARMALAEQSLPYVFPGSLDPMQIELMAAGDRILPALHVDWVRKLTGFVLEGMILDLRFSGGWFWPLLEVFEGSKPARVIRDCVRRPRRGLGARGMLCAYLSRLGEPLDSLGGELDAADALLAAVAVVGDRPT